VRVDRVDQRSVRGSKIQGPRQRSGSLLAQGWSINDGLSLAQAPRFTFVGRVRCKRVRRRLRGAAGTAVRPTRSRPRTRRRFKEDNTPRSTTARRTTCCTGTRCKPVPPPATPEPRVDLADVLPADLLTSITQARQITFHSVGDTGAAKVNAFQTAAQARRQRGERRRRDDSRRAARRFTRAGVLLPSRRRHLQLRGGAVLLRPVLRAVPAATTVRSLQSPQPTTARSSENRSNVPQVKTVELAFLHNFCAATAGNPRLRRPGEHDGDPSPASTSRSTPPFGFDRRASTRTCSKAPA